MSAASIAPTARPRPSPLSALSTLRLAGGVAAALMAPHGVSAQTAPLAPAPAASTPAKPDSNAQRVEVTGARESESEQRRQSTAAKIIVGRDEIERFGDASLGDMLQRLPGVTIGGKPGRGGAIRMRGLGSGYTQILLDGERVQGGLSLDSIDPEMVERIEIQRAPTAETGARAIAGTINIITREGFRKRLNDLKLGFGLENGIVSPGVSWTRDDKWGDLSYNVSINAVAFRRDDESVVTTTSPGFEKVEQGQSSDRRQRLNANGRLQWALDDGGSLMLMPLLVLSQGGGRGSSVFAGSSPPPDPRYQRSESDSDGGFTLARLNAQWRHRLGEGRMEWRGGVGASQSKFDSARDFFANDARVSTLEEHTDARERTLHLNGKYALTVGEANSFVAGSEVDLARRAEDSHTVQTDAGLDLVDNLRASTQRLALYAQDEWALTPQWAAHAGLRWEGITTEGEGRDAQTDRNRSSVWTPLLHAVWKPEPKSRDQVRVSLTRSYRSPTLQSLMGRLNISAQNSETSPDRTGNPDLRPELATGIDLAYEHYLPHGGLFSANVFHRRIRDQMRTLTTLEDVPWFPDRRWVARPQNVGNATTQGIELEAKFRLSDLVNEAPPVDLRANVSLFRSKVDSVPGPDNRLDSQPGGTANFGADYRWPGTPVTTGGNINYTPGYTTRLSDAQWLVQSAKRVLDAYVLWTINPATRVRVTASNLLQQDTDTVSLVGTEQAETLSPSFVNWRVQLELKL
ncbi:TonB-dependent receptor plug domain-containing protein [Ideonella sp.]|uniref:TonB-dependent receptor plug domain-containing protein n=1 Tax=Ideonella sp. TaxID=1929293 RepID=UPI0035AFF2E0